jgi:hypothetical protein
MEQKSVTLNFDEEQNLRFHINRCIINLYKDMLIILEDVAEEHDTALCKLQDSLPTEYKKYVDLADYLTEDKFRNLRGKILSRGNNTIREIEDQLKNFEFKLKNPNKQ